MVKRRKKKSGKNLNFAIVSSDVAMMTPASCVIDEQIKMEIEGKLGGHCR